ncbi:MAG: DUF5683 domain-containing protein [Bacteroidota bacterium]|nr:DUF5683 domain-containing protein [Bacteroidota bacterium]
MAKADSSKTRIIKMDSVKFVADTGTIVRLKHSPSKAALLSAVLPGLGQIYNKKYWKLPIVYAGIGISGYYFIRNQRWYKDYLQGYIDYTNSGGDVSTIQNLDKIKNYTNKEAALKFYMNLYRRWRDWSVFFLAGTYFLNIIDATVDGYLFDYDISDNLSMKVEPVMFRPVVNTGTGGALGLKLSFNLH